jgi:tRNA A37 threonylcarbamoyladenosine modification protein TsaB
MMLFLDTSDPAQTALYLLDKASLKAHIWQSRFSQQEKLHGEIAKFLKKYKVPLKKLTKVGVVTGPGHFSRVRTGVVTANTLGYALGILVVGVKKSDPIDFKSILKQKGQKAAEVFYDRAPNISQPKKKT